jgi:hypothetical protein
MLFTDTRKYSQVCQTFIYANEHSPLTNQERRHHWLQMKFDKVICSKQYSILALKEIKIVPQHIHTKFIQKLCIKNRSVEFKNQNFTYRSLGCASQMLFYLWDFLSCLFMSNISCGKKRSFLFLWPCFAVVDNDNTSCCTCKIICNFSYIMAIY